MSASRRADRVFSVVLIALAVYVIYESWRMPRLQELGVEPMTAPGLTPALIGLVLLVLGLTLFFRSWTLQPRDGDHRIADSSAGGESVLESNAAKANSEVATDESRLPIVYQRALYTLIIALVYALGLVGRMPFWLATALFVFSFVLVFERRQEQSWAQRLLVASMLAVVSSAVITGLFQEVFLVRLP